MRKLLKFLLVPALASQPVITVVACGTSTSFNADDVRNQALKTITNDTHVFQAKAELGISTLPTNNTTWEQFDKNAQAKIDNYYSGLVTNSPNFPYPTVAVQLGAISTDEKFNNLYTSVLATFQLKVTVTYQNQQLPSDQPITIKIMNDNYSNDKIVKNIGQDLTSNLQDGKTPIHAPNLPAYDSNSVDKSNLTQSGITTIQSAIENQFTNQSGLDYLQIPGLSIKIVTDANSQPTVYQDLKIVKIPDSGSTQANGIIATFSSLGFYLTYQPADGTTPIQSKLINVKNANFYQTIEEANSQFALIIQQFSRYEFNQTQLVNNALPSGATDSWNDYIKGQKSDSGFLKAVIDQVLGNIKNVYGPLKGTGAIDEKNFSIDTNSTTPFVVDTTDNQGKPYSGHFSNIKVTYDDKGTGGLVASGLVTLQLSMEKST